MHLVAQEKNMKSQNKVLRTKDQIQRALVIHNYNLSPDRASSIDW